MNKLITRRGLLRAAGFAAPALIIRPSMAQFEACLPGFCTRRLPNNIFGMWDASNFASLTITPVANLHSVADGSGHGNTMNKAGSSNFPQYSATGFNSRPAMVFTSTDECALEASAFPMGSGSTLTVWYVGTLASASVDTFGRFWSYTKPGAAADQNNVGSITFNTFASSQTQVQMGNNSVFTTVTGLTGPPAGHRIIVTKASSGVITTYIDNVVGSTGTSVGSWVSGGSMNIGMRHASIASGTDYLTGKVGEVGVSTDFSNTAAVAMLDAYLKNKWGL